jgi:hypothetical protein
MTAGAGLSVSVSDRVVWRRATALLVLLVPAAVFVVWSTSGVARACDPVTGEGCTTVPASSAPPASSSPTTAAQTLPPQRQAPSGGGPAAPATTSAAPAPPASVAPATTAAPPPTEAEKSSTSDTGGGGVPWQLGLAVPAVLLGAAGAGAVVVAKKKNDPLAAFANTCNDLCWLKQQEAQALSDIETAHIQLAQVDEAWRQAREYLRNQLRADYIAHRQKRALATVGLAASTPLSALVTGVGFPLSIAMHGTQSQWYGYFDPRHWNKQVNDELISAQALIDGMRNQKRAALEDKLALANSARDEASSARQAAQSKMDALRAQNPDTAFPACECA